MDHGVEVPTGERGRSLADLLGDADQLDVVADTKGLDDLVEPSHESGDVDPERRGVRLSGHHLPPIRRGDA